MATRLSGKGNNPKRRRLGHKLSEWKELKKTSSHQKSFLRCTARKRNASREHGKTGRRLNRRGRRKTIWLLKAMALSTRIWTWASASVVLWAITARDQRIQILWRFSDSHWTRQARSNKRHFKLTAQCSNPTKPATQVRFQCESRLSKKVLLPRRSHHPTSCCPTCPPQPTNQTSSATQARNPFSHEMACSDLKI